MAPHFIPPPRAVVRQNERRGRGICRAKGRRALGGIGQPAVSESEQPGHASRPRCCSPNLRTQQKVCGSPACAGAPIRRCTSRLSRAVPRRSHSPASAEVQSRAQHFWACVGEEGLVRLVSTARGMHGAQLRVLLGCRRCRSQGSAALFAADGPPQKACVHWCCGSDGGRCVRFASKMAFSRGRV